MTNSNRLPALDPDQQPLAPAAAATSSRPNLLLVVWRKRWLVLFAALIGVAASIFYLSKQTPIYESSSRLYIQDDSHKQLVGEDVAQQSSIATQSEIIRSAPLLATVADRPEVKSMKTLEGVDQPVVAIKAALTVTPQPSNNQIVTIAFDSPYPADASTMVNSVVDAYVDFMSKQRHMTAVEVLRLLQKEKEKREGELTELQKKMFTFKQDHGILSFEDEKGNIVFEKLAKLSENLTTAQLETIDAQAADEGLKSIRDNPAKLFELATAEHAKEVSVNINNDSANASDEKNTSQLPDVLDQALVQAEQKLSFLTTKLTPEHEDYKAAQAEVEFYRQQIADRDKKRLNNGEALSEEEQRKADELKAAKAKKELEAKQALVDGYISGIERRLTIATQKEKELQTAFETQKQEAFALNSVAAEYATMDSEFKRLERLCDLLADRIKEINVNEDTTGQINVGILDVARPGLHPVKPEKPRTVGIGLVVGLALGVGIAFLLDVMDQRINSVDEVVALLDAPVLGLIPHIPGKEPASLRGRKVNLAPTSDVAEAYRTIRTAVYFGAQTDIRKLLITSPAPGDGKTTSASNLAIAMAQAGRRVVLMDCDFRRPTQHKIFELKVTMGMADVMAGRATLDAATYSSGIDNLSIIPCGTLPSNPSELLNSQLFIDKTEELAKKFDLVVIDSPPVAPVTDARILGALCDATILVLRAEKSTRRLSEHAHSNLISVGARIIGAIINDVPRRRDRYGYYYGYGYGYSYRYYQYGYGPEQGNLKANGANLNGNGSKNGKGLVKGEVATVDA